MQLADKLSRTKGKKVYGYLKPEVKAIVDAIMVRLSENEQITKLYDLWYQQKENAIKVYSDELPPRISLVDNKEFKPLKNAIIQEALKISRYIYRDETADTDDERQELNQESVSAAYGVSARHAQSKMVCRSCPQHRRTEHGISYEYSTIKTEYLS